MLLGEESTNEEGVAEIEEKKHSSTAKSENYPMINVLIEFQSWSMLN